MKNYLVKDWFRTRNLASVGLYLLSLAVVIAPNAGSQISLESFSANWPMYLLGFCLMAVAGLIK